MGSVTAVPASGVERGEGGLSVATLDFMRGLRARCDAVGALLIEYGVLTLPTPAPKPAAPAYAGQFGQPGGQYGQPGAPQVQPPVVTPAPQPSPTPTPPPAGTSGGSEACRLYPNLC